MSSWFGRWFAYGLGKAAGRAIFDDERRDRPAAPEPIRQQSEAEIREAERRYDEEAKRFEEEDEARRRAAKRGARG